ncbi:MAG: hypothetical protein AUJ58_09495 [Zetaproteobacteria bacterium CG1_02_55_237]|nr:MAG: hypothetical protein AUJ58_09495 [Zetaproteobacteria bacterium CG1_02_55_237]
MRLHDADGWRHSQGVSHADLFRMMRGKRFSPMYSDSAETGDIACVRRYLRFEEDEVQVCIHALARCRRMEAFARGESCGLA